MLCFQLNYVKKFFCDGKICSSRCCRDWKISVDEKFFEKIQSLDDKQKILQNIKNNSINLTSQKLCSFLDEDFLCKIQKSHGEFFLPKICKTFPRIIYNLGENIFTQSLTLTCPVASNLILTQKNIFIENAEISSENIVIDFKNRIENPKKTLEIQTAAIKILQNKNFSINQRLKNLCEFFGIKIFNNFSAEKYADFFVEIFIQIYGANVSEKNKIILRKNFLQNKDLYLPENILENYLVNEFFMRCYPHAFILDFQTNCKIFVTAYKFLEFAMILTVIARKNLNFNDWINLICAVNDKIDHSKGGMDAIKNFVKNCDEKIFSELILEE